MDMHITTTEAPAAKAPPVPRNGVDTPKLFATIGAVASQPAIAQFRFRAESKWEGGTQSRSTIAGFYGVGAEMQHDTPFQASLITRRYCAARTMHPRRSNGCCTHSPRASPRASRTSPRLAASTFIRWNAASKAISICRASSVCRTRSATASRRSGSITQVKGDAPEEKLRKIVDQARARSAVFDILTGHVPVTIEVDV